MSVQGLRIFIPEENYKNTVVVAADAGGKQAKNDDDGSTEAG